MPDFPIRRWPVSERPRERLIRRGPHALSDAELLALFLGSGTPGLSAVELARRLLAHFEDLRGLLTADLATALGAPGLGPARYALLQAALELSRRHLELALVRGPGLAGPGDVRRFLRARLRDRPHEVFCCLYLDNRHRVIAFEELFRGTIDGASVHPRDVVKQALGHTAAAVILAHNHPSGVAEPSQADELITRRLRGGLGLVDIQILDHLVIGDTGCVSFAERGLL